MVSACGRLHALYNARSVPKSHRRVSADVFYDKLAVVA